MWYKLPTETTEGRKLKHLDVTLVMEAAKGPARLQQMLWRARQPFPSMQVMANWRFRGRIGGRWVAPIMWAFACRGTDPMKLFADRDMHK